MQKTGWGGPTGEIFLWEGRIFVRGCRSKLIFALIVYFAGFATAIYTLAPAPENEAGGSHESSVYSEFNSDEFVASFNSGMHKCVGFGKDAAFRTAVFIKQKIDEKQAKADG